MRRNKRVDAVSLLGSERRQRSAANQVDVQRASGIRLCVFRVRNLAAPVMLLLSVSVGAWLVLAERN